MGRIRSEKVKQDFIKYLEEHPGERFWQAVRNYSGFAFIIASDTPPKNTNSMADTFYWEDLAPPQPNQKEL